MAVNQIPTIANLLGGTKKAVPVLQEHADDVTGTITASGGTVTSTDCRGVGAVMVQISGTYGAFTLAAEGSVDGTNWFALPMRNPNSLTATFVLSSSLTANSSMLLEIPTFLGYNRVRVRATSWASGTANIYISTSSQFAPNFVQLMGNLPGGTNRIGASSPSFIGFVESTTALAASASVSGTSRDLWTVGTGAQANNGYPTEVRASGLANVTGTLALEVSNDNSTWFRVKTVTTVQATSGSFYAEIIHRPSHRYARAVYVNSTGAQSSFSLNTTLMA